MKKLSIIGCGKVGKTFAKLWSQHSVFTIHEIVNQSAESAASAIDFIGSGKIIPCISDMSPSDFFLITTSDNSIVKTCEELVSLKKVKAQNIVFHCSGAISSQTFRSAQNIGAYVGSVHPILSFTSPQDSINAFQGTYCAIEGDKECLDILSNIFEAIGGKTFFINSDSKTFYHAASVIINNYMTALIELGINTYDKAGLRREKAMEIIEPMVKKSIDSIFQKGTVSALTGPVSRGDDTVVRKQLNALSSWNSLYGNIYKDLGAVALELAKKQGNQSKESLSVLNGILK